MSTAHFLFLGRLEYFLPRDQRRQGIDVDFRGRQSIKHLAESLGVPHPEIGQVQVNSQESVLGAIAQDGDRVDLHPVPNGCPIEARFLLDNHLGRLTAYLRMLGFDCLYHTDYTDDQLAEILRQEERILLSRDRRLLMRKAVIHGYCPRSLDSQEQLAEVIQRFDLTRQIVPFQRCLRCNHPLETVSKEAVLDRLEPLTKRYFDEFRICPSCGQISVNHRSSKIARKQGCGCTPAPLFSGYSRAIRDLLNLLERLSLRADAGFDTKDDER